jgi:S-adenosylmethionine decarboxylase
MHNTGQELLVDLYNCTTDVLDDPSALEEILLLTAQAAGFQVVSRISHQFTHQGVTLVLILSQSHLALHTWPEDHFAAADVYVCGTQPQVTRALGVVLEFLLAQFRPKVFSHHMIERGLDSRIESPSA